MPLHPGPGRLRTRTAGQTMTVAFAFDGLAGPHLAATGAQLATFGEQAGTGTLRLDLSRVHQLDNRGLILLLKTYRLVRSLGGRLTICNANGQVYETLTASRLTEVLGVCTGRASA